MSEQHVLGIDAGTSSAKVGVVTREGLLQRVVSSPYPISSPHPGWTEQDSDDWWAATRRAIRDAVAGIDPNSVMAIGLSNAGGSMVALDSEGQPVRPAMVWMDTRAGEQAERLLSENGQEFWLSRLGYRTIAFTLGAKMVWLREREPDAYHRVSLVLQPADYVIYRMTGEAVTDRSTACATGMYNLRNGEWDTDILAAVGISKSMLPRLDDSGTIGGSLSPNAAAELGLPSGIPVVLGAWDQVCTVVGAGSTSGRDALLSAGTAWTLAQPTEELRIDTAARFWTVQHARRGQWLLMIAMSNGGAVVEWYRRLFAGIDTDHPEADPTAAATLSGVPPDVESVPAGSNGVLVLPHLIGAMGIHMEPKYSACILGLRHGTGRAEIFHAILEAVAYEVRWSCDVLAEIGRPTPALRMVGGATKSLIWPQVVADVTHLEVLIPCQTECAVLGAARLAQEALGIDVGPQSQAAGVMRHYKPNREAAAVYDRCYRTYQLAHRALEEPLARLDRERSHS
jgi:xylulokinase